MSLSPKVLNVIIILLFLVAAALVFAIYLQFTKKSSTPNQKSNQQTASYSAEIREALNYPDQGASDEVKKAFAEKVTALAQETNRITVSARCFFEPAIIRVKSEQKITIKNTDSLPHTLTIGLVTLSMPPGSEKTIEAAFGAGLGNYGYFCDSDKDVKGIIQVSAKS